MKKILIPSLLFVSSAVMAQTQVNTERMLGCWKTQKDAQENLMLTRDKNFVFSDYNSKTSNYETLTGSWKVIDGKLILAYDDRPKQAFKVSMDKKGNYKLTKAGGFEFIKAQPSECK